MIPEGWQRKTVGELCDFSNGNGFKPSDWSADGLPIIRIQNLNGEKSFNYYSGEVRGKWLVEPGQLLFAWAGTKGVSFGPKVWRGPLGVLNQHIFKVEPLEGVAKEWLYEALVHVTDVIEKKAHGFKATLLHVQKSDITEQVVPLPPLHEQKKIAQTLATWDEAITVTERLVEASQQQKHAMMQQLLTGKRRLPGFGEEWEWLRANEVFQTVSKKQNDNQEELLAVTQDQGVLPRSLLERRVVMPAGTTSGYKLVVPGNFIISLRSFQGGLEYSRYRGLVSPAYTVLEPVREICDDFYRHYYKSYNFIGHLAVAVIGIRDGKQISYSDFSFIKIPYPSLHEQKAIAKVLSQADAEIEAQQRRLDCLRQEKKALMQQLLTGKRRVKVEATAPTEEAAC